MGNLRKIGNKLFKETTELKSQEVQLKNISQLNENIKTANSLINKAEKEGDKFAQAEANLERAYSRFIKVRNELNYHANRIIPMDNDDFIKKTKELGLNANDVPQIKQLKKLADSLRDYVKFYDGVRKYKSQV
jgi:hypothetical protein